MKGMSLTCKMVSKWCNPSITYQKILIFQGKIPTFNKTLTTPKHFPNNGAVLSHHQQQHKINGGNKDVNIRKNRKRSSRRI